MTVATLTAPSATLSDTVPSATVPSATAGVVRAWKDAQSRGAGSEGADRHPSGELRLPELGARVSRATALAGFAAGAAMSMPVYPTLTMSVTAWPR